MVGKALSTIMSLGLGLTSTGKMGRALEFTEILGKIYNPVCNSETF